jgi:glycosyltransferase involved in cell wall biosynthesis
MKNVVIVQRIVCEYRKAFFSVLQKELADRDINLSLIVGTPRPGEESIDVLDSLPFGQRLPTTYFYKKTCWIHRLYATAKTADMVVVVQENSALYTYPLLITRLFGKTTAPRIGFWGHGANMGRVNSRILPDKWRKFWQTRVDWWFAYTNKTKQILTNTGVNSNRITVVNNSTDTDSLRNIVNKKQQQSSQLFLKIFNCRKNNKTRVGIFCGRLIESKMITFLLESISQIHRQLPDFFMIIVGDGPLHAEVEQFCANNSWCRWVGAKWSSDRADYLAIADIWLNPGAVGLAVTDAFAVGLPLATTDNKTHGPEIEYLKNKKNGLITPPIVKNYTVEILQLLTNDSLLQQTRKEAASDGLKYSVDSMAARFASGIEACLSIDKAHFGLFKLKR